MKVEFQKEFSLFFFIDQPILAPIFGASGLNRNDIVFRISHYTDYIKPNKNARVNTRYKAPLRFCLFSCRKISGDIRNKIISIHGHLFNQIKMLQSETFLVYCIDDSLSSSLAVTNAFRIINQSGNRRIHTFSDTCIESSTFVEDK